MKDGLWYTISGWMGNRLELRGNDLICFAVIYGFSMDGESQFKGNLDYLTGCMFASRPTALLSLNHLLECNLILKQEEMINGKKHCYYATNVIYDEGKFNVVDSSKEPLSVTSKEPLSVTSKEPLPKNYNNKEQYNKEEKRLSNDNPKVDESFEDFWRRYHRKGVKSKALKMWNRLNDKNKKFALDAVDDYVLFCKRSNRSQADGSTFLNQEYYLEDWKQVPACYQDSESDVDERTINFKRYMREKWPDLIYHRNPLTVEQGIEMIEKYGINQFEWLLSKLCERDVHQYYSIKQGIEKVYEETEANI